MVSEEGFDFQFDPTQCASCGGLCCLGDSGYVWISDDEIDRLAELLGLSLQETHDNYLYEAEHRFSIREIELANGGYACIFFDTEKRRCTIYEARPEQCRTFPFWDEYFLFKDETFYMCPGIEMVRESS